MEEFMVGKFIIRTPADRLYTAEGAWAQYADGMVRVGVSDFMQQRSGDAAFVEVRPAGTGLKAGEELAALETIKVTISLGSPVSGRVVEANPDLETAPERVNQDPYGLGWLAVLAPEDWERESEALMDGEAYAALAQRLAQEAV